MPDPSRPTVLVTNAGHGSAIAIIRALGRKGLRVLVGGSEPEAPGFRSRYAAGRVLYPSAEKDPAGCVSALRRAVCEHGVDLLIPISDAIILPLSEVRERFDGICRLALPDREGIVATGSKLRTLELAERHQVPIPRTRLVHTTAEAVGCAGELGWPVVLKPLSSRLYRVGAGVERFTVSYANTADQVREQMALLEGRCPVLMQEYFRGIGLGVELLMHEGRPLAAFQHRRLHEVPVTGGASSLRESVALDDELLTYATRMLQELRWTGLVMVEFKVGPSGPRLMEINGRIWGSLPLAVVSGMDFPGKLVDLMLQGPPPPDEPVDTGYRIGVRARNLELDLAWLGSVLARRRRYPFLEIPSVSDGVRGLLDLANPTCRIDTVALDDPLPALSMLRGVVLRLPEKLRQPRRPRAPEGPHDLALACEGPDGQPLRRGR